MEPTKLTRCTSVALFFFATLTLMIRARLVGTGLGTFTLQKASSHVTPRRAINIVVPSGWPGMQKAGVGDDNGL